MARINHRTTKLDLQKKARKGLTSSKGESLLSSPKSNRLFNYPVILLINLSSLFPVDRLLTFILLLEPSITHLPSLSSLHEFVQSSYLTRHDDELIEIEESRRTGRPASKREQDLKDCKRKEEEEYRTGMEIPDLTNSINVGLLRQWDGDSQSSLMFRIVRISRSFP